MFAADSDGVDIAYKADDGEKLWKTKTKLPITGGLGASAQLVVFVTRNGLIEALDATSGELKWKSSVPSESLAAPVVTDTSVVVQTTDGHLTCLDADSGKVRWSYETSLPILTLRGASQPIVAGDLAIAGFANGKVVALTLQHGSPVWERAVAEPTGRSELERVVDIDGNVSLDSGQLYAATYQGKVASLSVNSGQISWQRDVSTTAGVYYGANVVVVPAADGVLWAYDAATGAELWHNDQLRARTLSGAAIVDGYVVVGDFQGYLHWLSLSSGNFVARVKVDGDGLRSQPLVSGGIVYVQGNGGKLAALTVKHAE
ncbi:MAG TPA: outer membrane protein assembly factor BamB [Pseudomonadales bacterium]|nr:outer membrane protein assembly factor BamB [Pseudomonadales bacterium]